MSDELSDALALLQRKIDNGAQAIDHSQSQPHILAGLYMKPDEPVETCSRYIFPESIAKVFKIAHAEPGMVTYGPDNVTSVRANFVIRSHGGAEKVALYFSPVMNFVLDLEAGGVVGMVESLGIRSLIVRQGHHLKGDRSSQRLFASYMLEELLAHRFNVCVSETFYKRITNSAYHRTEHWR